MKNEHNFVVGANEKDYHLRGVEPGRDFKVQEFYDLRNVLPDETCPQCTGTLRIVNAIELGHIFKLGTKYSESMDASFSDSAGKEKSIFMGSYGIGLGRIIASFIEQNHDQKGIIWNKALSPYHCILLPLKNDDNRVQEMTLRIYHSLIKAKYETIIDDRDTTPGIKFKDADLLGIPLKIIIGDRWLKDEHFEIQKRCDDTKTFVIEKDILYTIKTLLN